MTTTIQLLTCVFLSLMLYGEQGYVTLMSCDHGAPQRQQGQADVRDSHAETDSSGGLPICPCHDGMACLCHLLAVAAPQTHLTLSLPSTDALPASSALFADLHPLKVFRPPIF
ncbi:MAG: hypothetical protein A3F84_11100 [Candidatus Handelsmanbacteria bacterium RIFCSPLOWO2_12_FULL_64_10]|uniref:Uncharacterized protein n=1 Tax=Handelsmanbacteria sp. (strain RIFCSPLOWO2_12_FULL_64_10) TaxID=1817868 RepID=A0A1F6D2J9_HANXR|nr:MAG: hypothetical protein A3F84_11100 [Candidatus Handelsmanbacteria bacterium RIFCSPLOWO2_12_FULL_64_10]